MTEKNQMSATDDAQAGPVLVISAHAGDFVWRAGGAMALAAARGAPVTVVCLSYGERGESAKAWREGKQLDEIKAIRRDEACRAAGALGASVEFLDAGDYPLRETDDLVDALVRCYRRVEPAVVLTHPLADPYNQDHPAAARMALQARVLAQAIGYDAPGRAARRSPGVLLRAAPARAVRLQAAGAAGHHRSLRRQARAPWSAWRRSRTCGPTTPTSPTPAAYAAPAQRRTQPRPVALDQGRGLHAAVPAGHQGAAVRNAIVTGCPRADRATSTRLAGLRRRDSPRGDRPHRLPRPGHPARPPRVPHRRHCRHRRVLAGRQPDDPRRGGAVPAGRHPRRHDHLAVRRRCIRRAAGDLAAASRRPRAGHHRRRARRRGAARDGLPGLQRGRLRAGNGEGHRGSGQRRR